MWEYLAALAIILLGYFIYSKIIPKYKLKRSYAKHFKEQGFKVLDVPFRPYGAPFHMDVLTNMKKHKDPFYRHKHEYYDVDVVVSNVLNTLCITCLGPKLIMEITGP
jgi:hypothetical protein